MAFNLASNSAGGTIIAWRRSFSLLSSWSTKHTLTVLLQHHSSQCQILVTNAYGPTDDLPKPSFIQELFYLATLAQANWLLAGDFNLARWLTDRSGNQRSFRIMELYNDFVRVAGIIDVPLQNRLYTWCSNKPELVFSKIDRMFMTNDWSSHYPVIMLQALEIIVFDHVPLLLSCKGLPQSKKRFQLELYWFKYLRPRLMVQNLWQQAQGLEVDLIQSFHYKTKVLHRGLKIWHNEEFGVMEKQLENCKNAILELDIVHETRQLTMDEFTRRQRLKEKVFELPSNIETKWKQRARCIWLSQGDRNTRYFHAVATSRMRRNLVLSIQYNEETVTDPIRIREIFFSAMKGLLGNSTPVPSFNATILYQS